MKKCPYCAEEILDDAIKCKHCGEWLNKEKFSITESSKKLFDVSKKFLKDAKTNYNIQRYKHLYIPTENNPFTIGEISFYPNRLVINSSTVDYSNISNVYFFSKFESMNGIVNDYEVSLKIYLNVENNFPIENRENQRVIDITKSKWFLFGSSKKNREKVQFISNFIHEKTIESRLNSYLQFIQQNGYLYYPLGYKIFNNGDLYSSGKLVDNICKAYSESRLSYGGEFSSPIGLSSYSDGFTLNLWHTPGERKFLLFSKSNDIQVTYDRDVFNLLLNNLLTNNTILETIEKK